MIYVVLPGDTVDSIAMTYNIEPFVIIYDNQLPYSYRLAIGQALYIAVLDKEADFSIAVNGYAYPFISNYVLNETLPYLTELSVFSYGFTTEGNLTFLILDDSWMVLQALNYGVNPILTLTPFGYDGVFNNNLISAVVNNEEAKNNLIAQLKAVLRKKAIREWI